MKYLKRVHEDEGVVAERRQKFVNKIKEQYAEIVLFDIELLEKENITPYDDMLGKDYGKMRNPYYEMRFATFAENRAERYKTALLEVCKFDDFELKKSKHKTDKFLRIISERDKFHIDYSELDSISKSMLRKKFHPQEKKHG